MTLSPLTPPSLSSLHARRQPVPGVRFGFQNPDASYRSTERIPDDVYTLFNYAPKTELHVHQGGSASVPFLSYCLRLAIQNNQANYSEWMSHRRNRLMQKLPGWATDKMGKALHLAKSPIESGKVLDEMPVFQENGPAKMVHFTDKNGKPLPQAQVRTAMEQALTLDNLRTYYRYGASVDNQKSYMDSTDIAETTAHRAQQPSTRVTAQDAQERQKRRAEGLRLYLQTSKKINPFVKNPAAFYKLANEYAFNEARKGVTYTEYRVSPSGSGIGGANGNNIEDVLSSVNQGFVDAQSQLNQTLQNLNYGLIVLFERQNRSKDEPADAKVKRAVQLAKDVVRLKQEGKYNICGVDLAGDEANNPVPEFKEAFDIIKAYNRTAPADEQLGITIHAGETPTSGKMDGYQSIQKAIEIAEDPNVRRSGLTTPVRIGHGLQLINSSPALQQAFEIYCQHPQDWEQRIDVNQLRQVTPLLNKVIQDKIVLEMCPKSNFQTMGVDPAFPKTNGQYDVDSNEFSAASYRRHPAVFLSRLGVKVTLSSDNQTISNTDIANEYVKMFKYCGLTYNDFKTMVMNGFEGAFMANKAAKDKMIADAQNRFTRMESDSNYHNAIQMLANNTRPVPAQ